MMLGVWLMSIPLALLILGWMDWETSKEDPNACFGSSFGVAVVFWPITFGIILFSLSLMYVTGFGKEHK